MDGEILLHMLRPSLRERGVRALMAKHALSPEDAASYTPAPGLETRIWRYLAATGVVRAAGGKWWVSQAALADYDRRRTAAAMVLSIGLGGPVAFGLMAWFYWG
jgi:hypothetical protein